MMISYLPPFLSFIHSPILYFMHFLYYSFLLRRNAMSGMGMDEPQQQPSSSSGEKGGLKERMVRAREQLDDLVEQTAGQFRKMKVSYGGREGGGGWQGGLAGGEGACVLVVRLASV